ncbi:MAG: CPBP family intramembrane metalloprotease [Bacteroidales bacterium]|nr:CPBP family intramembrane metalloprotease [Bacteroidales bacterium]
MKISFLRGTILLALLWLMAFLFFGILGSMFSEGNQVVRLSIVQIGIWLVPALFYAYFFYDDFLGDLKLKKTGSISNYGWFILLYATAIPLVGFLYQISYTLPFPEYLVEMSKNLKSQTDALVFGFLSGGTLNDLLIALFVMAVLPAICEEVFFRGVVLNNLVKRTGNIHLAVWLSAIVFSAVHFEVLGFLSRVVLGAALGYSFVLTKSLWVPIILHFLNNGIIVFAYFSYQKKWISFDPSETTSVPVWLTMLCLIAGTVLLRFLLKRYNSGAAANFIRY